MPQPTALIVDDDPDTRRTLRMLFEFEGFTVVGEAEGGPEATILAGECQPDVIMLDYKMPGMTGDETADILRRISPGSRIVAFSAYLDGQPPWADAFLDKKKVGELSDLLSGLLDRPAFPAEKPVPAGPRTVLIVDDEPEIRDVLRMLFEVAEFEVVGEAKNAVEAMRLCISQTPAFIILDYAMPTIDGEGAAKILRILAPSARIVAFSALLDARPDWADAFLNKERVADIAPLLEGLVVARGEAEPTRRPLLPAE